MGLTSKQKMMIAVLLSGTLLVVLNATMLSPALPHIMNDTGVGATTVQWLTSGYMLVEAVVIPMNAFFVGKFSTRKLFIGGIAWFGIASVVAALAPNFYVILLGRAMMAMATGVIMPMTFTLILLIFPREKRGSAMGIVGLIISFAPAIGPSLSGALVDTVGWRMLFIIVAVLAAIVVLFASFSLKNFEGFEQVPFDPASVFLLACGMIGLLYGISSATSAENILIPIALIGVGLVLLGLFVYRQTKLEVPLLRVQVLKTRRFRTVVILIALLQASLVGSEVVLPIYVQQVMGQTATVSGLLMPPRCRHRRNLRLAFRTSVRQVWRAWSRHLRFGGPGCGRHRRHDVFHGYDDSHGHGRLHDHVHRHPVPRDPAQHLGRELARKQSRPARQRAQRHYQPSGSILRHCVHRQPDCARRGVRTRQCRCAYQHVHGRAHCLHGHVRHVVHRRLGRSYLRAREAR